MQSQNEERHLKQFVKDEMKKTMYENERTF